MRGLKKSKIFFLLSEDVTKRVFIPMPSFDREDSIGLLVVVPGKGPGLSNQVFKIWILQLNRFQSKRHLIPHSRISIKGKENWAVVWSHSSEMGDINIRELNQSNRINYNSIQSLMNKLVISTHFSSSISRPREAQINQSAVLNHFSKIIHPIHVTFLIHFQLRSNIIKILHTTQGKIMLSTTFLRLCQKIDISTLP